MCMHYRPAIFLYEKTKNHKVEWLQADLLVSQQKFEEKHFKNFNF